MFSSGNSHNSMSFAATTPLRIGAGLTLLYLHAWTQVRAAYFAVWKQQPWDAIDLLQKAGLPAPKFIAVTAALLGIIVALGWLLGFLTRASSFIMLPLSLGALWVTNRVTHSSDAEASLLYFFIAVTLVITGPGWFSLDALFKFRRKPKKSSGFGYLQLR